MTKQTFSDAPQDDSPQSAGEIFDQREDQRRDEHQRNIGDRASRQPVEHISDQREDQRRDEHQRNIGDRASRFFMTLSVLATLMLGFAIFLLLSFNWKYLAPVYKMEIVFGAFFAAYGGALFFRNRKEMLSELLLFGGSILYGVGIWQIGQIFNIDAHYPQGIWCWALGVWLLSFLARTSILSLFAAVLLGIWAIEEMTCFPYLGITLFRDWGVQIPNAAWTLPPLAGLGAYYGLRKNRPVVTNGYLLAIFLWGVFLASPMEMGDLAIGYMIGWFALFILLGLRVSPKHRRYVALPAFLGWAAFLVTLQLLCFYRANDSWMFSDSLVRFLPPAILALALGFLMGRGGCSRTGKNRPLSEGVSQGGGQEASQEVSAGLASGRIARKLIHSPPILGLILLVAMVIFEIFLCGSVSPGESPDEWKNALRMFALTLLANLAMISVTFWLLTRAGYLRGLAFTAGILSFIAWSCFRYFDLFGDFGGMLGAAAFFALLAVALFVIGWFWSRAVRRLAESKSVPKSETETVSQETALEDAALEEAAPQEPQTGEKSSSKGVLPRTRRIGNAFFSEALFSEKLSRKLIYAVILFEMLVLGGMIYSRTVPFRGAETITVETEPVDPRDLFRGDYVILDYAFTDSDGKIWRNGKEEKLFDSTIDYDKKNAGRTVYAAMKIGDDQIARPVKLDTEPPAEGPFLKGVFVDYARIRYGIHSFYVPEGTGREIEEAMRAPNADHPPLKKVLVDLLVNKKGEARIKDVRIVELSPEEQAKIAAAREERIAAAREERIAESEPLSAAALDELVLLPHPTSITPPDFPAIRQPAMKWAQEGHFAKDPSVIRFGGKYLLYYSYFLPPEGKDRKLTIGVAESNDLTEWRFIKNILPMQECDRNGLGAPCAKVIDGRVWLFYQTYGNQSRDAICCASSENGLDFSPHPENPIFRPHGDWNNGRAIDADVVFFHDQVFLYAATRDPDGKIQQLVVATADPKGGFGPETWTQAVDEPIFEPILPWETRCIEAPSVVEKEGRLLMFYAGGYNNDPQHIGLAESEDGLHWKRVWSVPFLTNGPKDQWNASESGHPGVFQDDDGTTWLFYQGNATQGKDWFLSRVRLGWSQTESGHWVPWVRED